jgi:hypothetical protein
MCFSHIKMAHVIFIDLIKRNSSNAIWRDYRFSMQGLAAKEMGKLTCQNSISRRK